MSTSKFIVSFIDNGPRYVKVRTSRDFGRLSDALKFFDTLKEKSEPELEREITIIEKTPPQLVKISFDMGYNDARNKKSRQLEINLIKNKTKVIYWAYCEGYAKAKYNL